MKAFCLMAVGVVGLTYLPVSAWGDEAEVAYAPFVIEAAKTLPTGEQTTKGGFGKAVILSQNFRPKSWAVTLADASVKQVVNSLQIKAGVPLTATLIEGKTYFCSWPVNAYVRDADGVRVFYYVRLAEVAQVCLSDEDADGVFDHKRRVMQSSSVPSAAWEYTSVGPEQPLETAIAYKRDMPESRPYGQLNVFLLTLPFTKGYHLCLQEMTIGGADMTVGCQNAVPAEEGGPVSLSIGKLKVDVKSRKGGIFTYEIISGFDGESYPGYK